MLGGRRIGTYRIGTYNGFLLACYFIPAWSLAALKIWESPIRGLFDRTNVAPAIFVSDYLNLSSLGTVRFAWLLALAKVVVAIFLTAFLALSARKSWRDNGNGEEALSIALIIGLVVSFTSMILASKVGETEALRLHATETMLLLGGAIVLLVQPQSTSAAGRAAGVEHAVAPVQSFSSPNS